MVKELVGHYKLSCLNLLDVTNLNFPVANITHNPTESLLTRLHSSHKFIYLEVQNNVHFSENVWKFIYEWDTPLIFREKWTSLYCAHSCQFKRKSDKCDEIYFNDTHPFL